MRGKTQRTQPTITSKPKSGTFSGPFFGSSVIGLAQLILQLSLVLAVVPLLPGGFVTQWEHHCLKALAESARR